MYSLRRSFILSLAFTSIVLLFLVACSLDSATSQTTPTTPSAATSGEASTETPAAPETGTTATQAVAATTSSRVPQGGTLTVRITEPITTFRPWDLRSRGEEYAADLLYNGLTRLDSTLKPEPDLADHWETSPNGGIITFTLRSDVKWHDGTPLTSDDVTWTLNALRTMTATNSLMYDLQTVIGEVRSPITGTVVLSLTQAYAPLLADLAVPILPRHILQNQSPEQLMSLNFWDNPVGTGPFKFGERNERGLSFVRNEVYFRGRPNLQGVALVVAPDSAIATSALNDGTLLLAEFPLTTTGTTTSTLDPALQRGSYPENGSYFLAFNVRAEHIFSDTRVRQALALAVDVPTLVKKVTTGAGEPIATSISPAAWAYPATIKPTTPNIDQARQLLDQAGWKSSAGGATRERNGITLTAQIFVRGDDAVRVAAAQQIAAAAEQIGMKLEVAPADFRTVVLAKLAPPYDFDLLLSSWANAPNSTGFPTYRFYDPDDYALFGADRIWRGASDTREGLRNIGGFDNPDYERDAKQARTTYDPIQRATMIASAEQDVHQQLPYLFLWTNRIPFVVNSKVHVDGSEIATSSPRYFWNIERWYLQP